MSRDYQPLTQNMLLRNERHKFLVPELDLLLFGKRTHVSNDRRFLLHDVIDLVNDRDKFRCVLPHFGVVVVVPALNIDQPSFLISLLDRVVKLAVFLQFLIVRGQQGFDLGVGGNILRHRLELVVLNIRNPPPIPADPLPSV